MKETFYFTHDYNARSDEKIKKLIRKHGMEGYGLFWSIVEDLYQNANEMVLDFDLLSYDYRIDIDIVKSIVEDFDIFTFKDGKFGSKSVEKRLSERDYKSKKASDNARKRWGENESRVKASECIFYVIKLKSDDESFIKCGITTESISRRYSGKTDIYSYDVIYQKEVSVENGIEIENNIKKSIQSYSPRNKFAGYLECYDEENLSNILNIAMQNDCNCIAKNESGNAIKEKKRKEKKENNTEKDTIVSSQAIVPTDNRNKEINDLLEVIKGQVEFLGFIYKKGKYERERAKNILTGKDFGAVCERAGMSRVEFCKNIIYTSTLLTFWNGKINNAETIYEHYAKVYNDAVNKKTEMERPKSALDITL